MGVLEWVILVVVVAGIVIAVLGWDRYRGTSEQGRWPRPRSRPARCSSTPRPASRCECGTTLRPESASTATKAPDAGRCTPPGPGGARPLLARPQSRSMKVAPQPSRRVGLVPHVRPPAWAASDASPASGPAPFSRLSLAGLWSILAGCATTGRSRPEARAERASHIGNEPATGDATQSRRRLGVLPRAHHGPPQPGPAGEDGLVPCQRWPPEPPSVER